MADKMFVNEEREKERVFIMFMYVSKGSLILLP